MVAIGATGSLAACAVPDTVRVADAPEPPAVSTPLPLWEAADAIAKARCDRQVACNDVGPSGQFLDEGACLRALQGQGPDALDLDDECHLGIDRPAFYRCVEAIRTQSCDESIDSYESIDVCAEDMVCVAGLD
jgi:hypothetical protein